jgi:flagellar biosynthesis protein FlhF
LREDGNPTVAVFVGPTGVGKTTTIAKIAANFALNHKKNVGFITADTYRIAAVEQLKTYAEILGMPVSVIYSPSEIRSAIIEFSDKDLILIDTAGRSHRNKSQFEELKTLVAASGANEAFLVLSATTSIGSCKEILKNYDFLKDYKLIFTKLDEVREAGIILNVKSHSKKSLSYLTTGQSVPDDIEVANIDKITKILLGSIT